LVVASSSARVSVRPSQVTAGASGASSASAEIWLPIGGVGSPISQTPTTCEDRARGVDQHRVDLALGDAGVARKADDHTRQVDAPEMVGVDRSSWVFTCDTEPMLARPRLAFGRIGRSVSDRTEAATATAINPAST
jgi:hypothetical protein